jgi:4a-hydroxytetrahydrobiopterin dehydratase
MNADALHVVQHSPDQASIITVFEASPIIQSVFPSFLDQAASEPASYAVIQSMTEELINVAKQRNQVLTRVPVTLVPILRGALPMYVAASRLFESPFCVLARGSRANGDAPAQVEWLGRRPFPLIPENGHILLLDTVIATGGTILSICDELMTLSGPAVRYITILSCYVSPNGLKAVAKHPLVRDVIVAASAESVDDNGYTVPFPGDIGDKLFGKRHSANEES